jgi:hypothetical protein
LKHAILIIALCVAASIAYGVIHDQITARICVEYFSKTHPHLINSESPTLLALAWGVVATWWVGLGLGFLIALAARAGRWPPLDARDLVTPVLILLATMATFATLAGFAGYHLSADARIVIPEGVTAVVPRDRLHRWMGVWYAHNASYDIGFVGGVVVAVLTLMTRRRRANLLACAT